MTTHTSHHAQTSSGPSHSTYRKEAQIKERNSSVTSSVAKQAAGNALLPWNMLADLGRQQLAIHAEMRSAFYLGSEAMRTIQQDTAHEASARHGAAAQKLNGSCEPADLLAIQTELLRVDLQSAGKYWQQLAAVALQTQREMMGSMSHLLDGENGGGVKSALKAFQTVIPPMATSYFFASPNSENEQYRHI